MQPMKPRTVRAAHLDAEAARLLALAAAHLDRRVVVCLGGHAGSGKTGVASRLVAAVNALAPGSATVAPMDGFHFPRAVLDQMPDPALAHARRGAAFTFDAPAYLAALSAITSSPPTPFAWPGFDHAAGDPVANGHPILPTHRVVVVEGLYTACTRSIDQGGEDAVWAQAAQVADERWWVCATPGTETARLARRHVATGLAVDLKAAHERIERNDAVNGAWIDARVELQGGVHVLVDNEEEVEQ
ncbi:hypothetical protein H9P43_004276 [Blastocladiella emersonii ATCC 22665]|nr:hypothetical protein H9P43_004276 [Blastocladiella emersonii ATCC 22665]